MYEYRKLSAPQRIEIVKYRMLHGYPLHTPPHPHHEQGYFLITSAIFEHKHLMSDPMRRTAFEINLLQGFIQKNCQVHAWIVLPNHYHVLLQTDAFQSISLVIKQLHGSSSREWNLQDAALGRKVWFNYSDRKVRGDRHFFATLNYLHYNPVKHGYVEVETDWSWSSIHQYLTDYGEDWIQERKREYPILDYGRKWDSD